MLQFNSVTESNFNSILRMAPSTSRDNAYAVEWLGASIRRNASATRSADEHAPAGACDLNRRFAAVTYHQDCICKVRLVVATRMVQLCQGCGGQSGRSVQSVWKWPALRRLGCMLSLLRPICKSCASPHPVRSSDRRSFTWPMRNVLR